jgi:hypothetical protein
MQVRNAFQQTARRRSGFNRKERKGRRDFHRSNQMFTLSAIALAVRHAACNSRAWVISRL